MHAQDDKHLHYYQNMKAPDEYTKQTSRWNVRTAQIQIILRIRTV